MRRVRLLSEVLGALGAGALVLLIARQAGIGSQRAVGAVALVPLALAALLAAPALRAGAEALLDEHGANASLSSERAQLEPGVAVGVNVDFLAWAKQRIPGDDTFHLEIGPAPGEEVVGGVGARQATILQWSLFQLAPHLAVEQSPKARDLVPGEGRGADWYVFYEAGPEDYPAVRLGKTLTWAPGFSIGRNRLAR
jgi:hypothetical protein